MNYTVYGFSDRMKSLSQAEKIHVKVLYFGAVADAVGTRSEDLELPSGAVSGAAFGRILERFPQLGGRQLLFSVEQRYASGDEDLNDGDELAIFTAVSGG